MGKEEPGCFPEAATSGPGVLARTFLCYHTPKSFIYLIKQTNLGQVERINYVPQLSSATLAGRLTQSTLTLDQPRGQFSHLNISDFDAIWLVVAHSNATQNFTAPQRMEDTPVPADLPQRGYYLTLRANRALYPGGPPSHQLQVLRVGNDTRCSPRTRGCNHPLPGPGPYRVKFLVMSDRGPMAETEWSSETRLQQAEALPAAPGSQSVGAVVIIAILSVLLAVLLTALLALLIYTWCRSKKEKRSKNAHSSTIRDRPKLDTIQASIHG